jgi:hypothetical protein
MNFSEKVLIKLSDAGKKLNVNPPTKVLPSEIIKFTLDEVVNLLEGMSLCDTDDCKITVEQRLQEQNLLGYNEALREVILRIKNKGDN